MNKTIIELREEAIKEDKNPEFYLYQKLQEKDKEIERLNNIINKAIKHIKEHTENIDRGRYYEDYVETYDLLNILNGGDEE